jgi:hypothetical protein
MMLRSALVVYTLVLVLNAGLPIGTRAHERASAPCATTLPPDPLFVPPFLPFAQHAPSGRFWYGTKSLWTLLDIQGRWHMGGKRPYSTKLFYWRLGYDARREMGPKLFVSAKRLDREAPLVLADSATNAFLGESSAMLTGIDIPTAGCWEVTAQYRGDVLSFVVPIQP